MKMSLRPAAAFSILIAAIASTGFKSGEQQDLSGEHWTARKSGNTYIVSVQDRSSILDALTDFVTSRRIGAGQVVGIGATNEATLRFFDPKSKQYRDQTFKEQMEISNLSGNISEADGKPLLHLHVSLGRSNYQAMAGHLLDAKIRGAGEFFVYPLDSTAIKIKNDDVGLFFYQFKHPAD